MPEGDGAVTFVRRPFPDYFFDLSWGGVFDLVELGKAFFESQVAVAKNVGAPKSKDKKHFGGPGANAFDSH